MVFSPYAGRDEPRAFVILMWKDLAPADVPAVSPGPAFPSAPSDVMELVGFLTDRLGAGLAGHLLEGFITEEIARRYPPGSVPGRFPGEVFGPTSLPPGGGTSTEIAFSSEHVRVALSTLEGVLRREAARGRHLLGAVALRFLGGPTGALLGMNVHPVTCCIEIPSIRNREVHGLYRTIWNEFERAGIPFTCHWGQTHALNPSILERYYGDRVDRWKRARRVLLDSPKARRVFASPTLHDTGLDGGPRNP